MEFTTVLIAPKFLHRANPAGTFVPKFPTLIVPTGTFVTKFPTFNGSPPYKIKPVLYIVYF